jgi:hypothetical protein
MQAYAAEVGAAMQLAVMLPGRPLAPADTVEQYTYARHFVAVDDPTRFLEVFPGLPADSYQTNKIIIADKPCKLCMDFDGKEGLPACFASQQDFTSRVQAALTDIFATEFGVQLQAESFVWVFSQYPVNFSAHLIVDHIMPDGGILCMPHHHPAQATHDGAKHFYNQLVQVMPELEEHKLIDGSIYTRDREMRLPGATKPPKPGVLIGTWAPNTAYIATNHSLADAMVSYLKTHATAAGWPCHALVAHATNLTVQHGYQQQYDSCCCSLSHARQVPMMPTWCCAVASWMSALHPAWKLLMMKASQSATLPDRISSNRSAPVAFARSFSLRRAAWASLSPSRYTGGSCWLGRGLKETPRAAATAKKPAVAFCAACATSWLSAASVVNCSLTAATEAAGVVESVDNPTQEQEHQSACFPRQESFLSGETGTLAQKPAGCHTAKAAAGVVENPNA